MTLDSASHHLFLYLIGHLIGYLTRCISYAIIKSNPSSHLPWYMTRSGLIISSLNLFPYNPSSTLWLECYLQNQIKCKIIKHIAHEIYHNWASSQIFSLSPFQFSIFHALSYPHIIADSRIVSLRNPCLSFKVQINYLPLLRELPWPSGKFIIPLRVIFGKEYTKSILYQIYIWYKLLLLHIQSASLFIIILSYPLQPSKCIAPTIFSLFLVIYCFSLLSELSLQHPLCKISS